MPQYQLSYLARMPRFLSPSAFPFGFVSRFRHTLTTPRLLSREGVLNLSTRGRSSADGRGKSRLKQGSPCLALAIWLSVCVAQDRVKSLLAIESSGVYVVVLLMGPWVMQYSSA